MKPLYLLFPFLFMSLLILETADQHLTAPGVLENLFSEAPFYPAEELPVHIAGGFFSVFDRRQGYTHGKDTIRAGVSGSIRIRLEGLEHREPWVYHPSGAIELIRPNRRKISLEMQRLDYYLYTPTRTLWFRLTGYSGGAEWCLLCRVRSAEAATLEGLVFRKGPFGICRRICGFTIRGRGGNEAETHLQKVVTPATRVHGDVEWK